MDAQARKQRAVTSDRVDPAKPASIVIDQRFNGLTHFCDLTGFPVSTANDWRIKGYIPATRRDGSPCQSRILAVAAEHSIPLEPADFVEQPAGIQESPAGPPPVAGEGAAAAHGRPTACETPLRTAAAPTSGTLGGGVG